MRTQTSSSFMKHSMWALSLAALLGSGGTVYAQQGGQQGEQQEGSAPSGGTIDAALEEWFKTAVSPNSQAYYLLAVAYYQQDDTTRALPPAQKAVELMDKPQENWVSLLLALYMEKEQYKDAIPLLERLIALADTVSLPARGAEVVARVRRAARVFGESTLPTIDLLRLGLLL